jgi:hypothetical protein
LYDWRPVSIYPISLIVLFLAILLSLRYLDVRRRNKPLPKV